MCIPIAYVEQLPQSKPKNVHSHKPLPSLKVITGEEAGAVEMERYVFPPFAISWCKLLWAGGVRFTSRTLGLISIILKLNCTFYIFILHMLRYQCKNKVYVYISRKWKILICFQSSHFFLFFIGKWNFCCGRRLYSLLEGPWQLQCYKIKNNNYYNNKKIKKIKKCRIFYNFYPILHIYLSLWCLICFGHYLFENGKG